MKYFLLETMRGFSTAPQIQDWHKQMDARNITPGRIEFVAQRTLFKVAPHPKPVFVDLLTTPFFMVTEKVKTAIELYDPHIQNREAILLDPESGLSEIYYLLAFKRLNCLSPESELSIDRSVIIKAVLDYEIVKKHPIFKIGDVRNSYIVARMDTVESILRRNPRGIALRELKTTDERG